MLTGLNAVANNDRVRSQFPAEGKMVSVDSGKHKGKVGKVQIHMRDKFAYTRYSTEASLMLQDCVGRTGFVVRIDLGDAFIWIKADNVTVL